MQPSDSRKQHLILVLLLELAEEATKHFLGLVFDQQVQSNYQRAGHSTEPDIAALRDSLMNHWKRVSRGPYNFSLLAHKAMVKCMKPGFSGWSSLDSRLKKSGYCRAFSSCTGSKRDCQCAIMVAATASVALADKRNRLMHERCGGLVAIGNSNDFVTLKRSLEQLLNHMLHATRLELTRRQQCYPTSPKAWANRVAAFEKLQDDIEEKQDNVDAHVESSH